MSAVGQLWRVGAVAVLAALVCGLVADPAAAETRRQRQWYLDALSISRVHQITKGSGVIVGVVDSGVDAGQVDMVGRVLPGTRTDGAAGDGRTDENGHGTHIAGVIAATKAGADGVLGIAPEVKVLPIKTQAEKDTATDKAIKGGIRAAVDGGAKVINISIAGPGTPTDADDINYALSKDVVVVAGAGNTNLGQTQIMWPAMVPGVIAATGLNKGGSFWSGSAQGPEAVLSAPAEDIMSTASRLEYASGYSLGSGTSDATAIISGVAALIRAKYPSMSAANVINRLIRTADDAGPPGRDPQYGFGKVNPLKALTANVPDVSSNPLLPTPSATPSVSESGDPIDKYLSGEEGTPPELIAAVAGIVVTVIAVICVVAGLLVRSRRRRAVQVNAAMPAMPPPGARGGTQPTADTPPGWPWQGPPTGSDYPARPGPGQPPGPPRPGDPTGPTGGQY